MTAARATAARVAALRVHGTHRVHCSTARTGTDGRPVATLPRASRPFRCGRLLHAAYGRKRPSSTSRQNRRLRKYAAGPAGKPRNSW